MDLEGPPGLKDGGSYYGPGGRRSVVDQGVLLDHPAKGLLYASRFPTAILYRKVRGYTDHLFGLHQAVKTTGKSIESRTPFPCESRRALLQTRDSTKLKNFQNREFKLGTGTGE